MKLTTVLGCVNDNPRYYRFIPYQIYFWKKFGLRFITFFVGDKLPEELLPYQEHIRLWNKTPELSSIFVAQNLRIYAPTLLSLPDDELVMITDMDMLPMNDTHYTSGLEHFEKDDFIYYNDEILHNTKEIFMSYNSAHPETWAKAFDIQNESDIIQRLRDVYLAGDTYHPGSAGWFIDQHTLYNSLLKYPRFHMLHRHAKRLETWHYIKHMNELPGQVFIDRFDDAHFHRDFDKNRVLIEDAKAQLDRFRPDPIILI
jgi:hypothetical protein